MHLEDFIHILRFLTKTTIEYQPYDTHTVGISSTLDFLESLKQKSPSGEAPAGIFIKSYQQL